MEAPTSDDVRQWSKLDWSEFGYDQDDPDPLDEIVARAEAMLVEITGREFDDTFPVRLEPLARQATQGITETMVMRTDEGTLDTASDFILLSSFSAGAYSENRRETEQSLGRGMGVRSLPPGNPLITDILWLLMTEAKQEYWQAWLMGKLAPYASTTAVAWGRPYVLGWQYPPTLDFEQWSTYWG